MFHAQSFSSTEGKLSIPVDFLRDNDFSSFCANTTQIRKSKSFRSFWYRFWKKKTPSKIF